MKKVKRLLVLSVFLLISHSTVFAVGYNPLIEASEMGNVFKVKQLIINGTNVNEDDKNYAGSALHYAVKYGQLEVVKELVGAGANVNASNIRTNDCTPLHYAAAYGHLDIVMYLLKSGADPLIFGLDNVTPLSIAVSNNHLEIVRALLNTSNKQYINMRFGLGGTPIITAVKNGNIPMVKLLLENGANPNIKNVVGENAFDVAKKKGYFEIESILRNY